VIRDLGATNNPSGLDYPPFELQFAVGILLAVGEGFVVRYVSLLPLIQPEPQIALSRASHLRDIGDALHVLTSYGNSTSSQFFVFFAAH
jgi:hypothetical protein